VGLLSVAVSPAPSDERKPAWPRRRVLWFILACYLLISVGLSWRLWSDPAQMAPTNGIGVSPDIYLNTWFMRYAATAVAHGRLPALITTAINYPHGVSAMWNTSILLPSVLLTPITLIAGPLTSLAVLVTLGFAGSATTMLLVLRRWGASAAAAAVGGAVYAFSPAMMVAAADHYHLQFAVLPPLIVDAVLCLVTGRGQPVRIGTWLGVLVAAQVFIAEELLVDTALVCVVLLLVLVATRAWVVRATPRRARLWFPRPRRDWLRLSALRRAVQRLPRPHLPRVRLRSRVYLAWSRVRRLRLPRLRLARPRLSPLRRARLRGAAMGFGVAAGIGLLLAGYALWEQFRGPLHESGSPWRVSRYGNIPADFVTAPWTVFFHGSSFVAFVSGSGQRLVEYFAYLSWPVIALLALIAIFFWHDMRVRITMLAFAVLEVLSIGGHRVTFGGWRYPIVLLPWHWLWDLPVLSQVVPNRISILADGVAAAAVAFAIDAAREAVPSAPRWRRPVIAAVAALALLPIIPRPVSAAAVAPPPPGWRGVIAGLHLRAGDPVLVLPAVGALTMEWQAVTAEPISVVGGYCITAAPNGHAAACDTARTLQPVQEDALLRIGWLASGLPPSFGPHPAQLAAALAGWHPAAVVALTNVNSFLGRYLVGYFGRPTIRQHNVLGWRVHRPYLPVRGGLRYGPLTP
jgi:hypothetical protein